MFKARSFITFFTVLTLIFLIAGVAKIHLDGQKFILSESKNKEGQVETSLNFINFTVELKSFFLNPYDNPKELEVKRAQFEKALIQLQPASLLSDKKNLKLEKLKEDFLDLQQKRSDILKTVKKKQNLLEEDWNHLFISLKEKAAKRFNKKQEFLPGFKEKLNSWSKTLPLLGDLKKSIDVSYVQKGKFEELQSILSFIQWLYTHKDKGILNYKVFNERLKESLLDEVEKTEMRLYYGEVLKSEELLKDTEISIRKIDSRLNAHRSKVDLFLKEDILPSWQSYISEINNQDLKKKAESHELILQVSTALAVTIILILFLYTIKLRSEERQNRKLNDSLQRVRRFSERGELAAKMAHEIKNPLSILTYCLGDGLENLEQGNIPAAKEEIQKSIETLARLKSISQNVGARVEPSEKGLIDLTKILKDLSFQYQSWLEKENLSLDLQLSLKKAPLKASRLEILGAFSNLLDNAIEYLKENLKENSKDDKEIKITLKKEGNHYQLKFQNGGPQIKNPKELFNNFYSTKDGVDRGLGLSIVKDIIEREDGSIQYSFEEHLNTFTIHIPLSV